MTRAAPIRVCAFLRGMRGKCVFGRIRTHTHARTHPHNTCAKVNFAILRIFSSHTFSTEPIHFVWDRGPVHFSSGHQENHENSRKIDLEAKPALRPLPRAPFPHCVSATSPVHTKCMGRENGPSALLFRTLGNSGDNLGNSGRL